MIIWVIIALIAKVVCLTDFSLSSLTSLQGMRLTPVDPIYNDNTFHDVSAGGDFNGDGIPDMIITFGPLSYIVYGSRGQPADIDISSMTKSQGFSIRLLSTYNFNSPPEVYYVGDVNGDGLDDIVAFTSDHSDCDDETRYEAYVIYGKRTGADDLEIYSDFELSDEQGFKITNRECFVQESLNHGDLNGDGVEDFVLTGRKTSHVIFGKRGNLPDIDLLELASPDGFKIKHVTFPIPARIVISDINSDGVKDIIVSYFYWTSTWVVFGRKSGNGDINLDNLASAEGFKIEDLVLPTNNIGDVNGDGINDFLAYNSHDRDPYVIYGKNGTFFQINLTDLQASAGFQIDNVEIFSDIGDVNRDGIADFLIGDPSYSTSYFATEYGIPKGRVLILFGSKTGFPRHVDLRELTRTQAVQITGSEDGDELGLAVSSVGDLNGDGISDILIGGRSTVYVIYGGLCTQNVQCTNPFLPICSSSLCSPCKNNADCAHLSQTPVCFDGRCVTCMRNSDCSFFPSSYCDSARKTCLSCPEGCSTCMDPSTCLICKPGFVAQNFNCVRREPKKSGPPPFVIMIATLMGTLLLIFVIRLIQLKYKKKLDNNKI